MSRVFVTGSSTGLGLMAAQLLVEKGHQVVVHGATRPAPMPRVRRFQGLRPRSLAICPVSAKCAPLLTRSIALAGSMR